MPTCIRLDIANFLRNQGDAPIRGALENGRKLSDAEVRQRLEAELTAGHAFYPLCEHNNFDHETGWCRGPKAPLNPYWVTFADLTSGCVEAVDGISAKRLAESAVGKIAKQASILPYPAEPRIGSRTNSPSFCFCPESCKGKTACPRKRSCTE